MLIFQRSIFVAAFGTIAIGMCSAQVADHRGRAKHPYELHEGIKTIKIGKNYGPIIHHHVPTATEILHQNYAKWLNRIMFANPEESPLDALSASNYVLTQIAKHPQLQGEADASFLKGKAFELALEAQISILTATDQRRQNAKPITSSDASTSYARAVEFSESCQDRVTFIRANQRYGKYLYVIGANAKGDTCMQAAKYGLYRLTRNDALLYKRRTKIRKVAASHDPTGERLWNFLYGEYHFAESERLFVKACAETNPELQINTWKEMLKATDLCVEEYANSHASWSLSHAFQRRAMLVLVNGDSTTKELQQARNDSKEARVQIQKAQREYQSAYGDIVSFHSSWYEDASIANAEIQATLRYWSSLGDETSINQKQKYRQDLATALSAAKGLLVSPPDAKLTVLAQLLNNLAVTQMKLAQMGQEQVNRSGRVKIAALAFTVADVFDSHTWSEVKNIVSARQAIPDEIMKAARNRVAKLGDVGRLRVFVSDPSNFSAEGEVAGY